MRVTGRDLRILGKLAAARWLTTRQVAELSFPNVSMEMARRRLRLLRQERYIVSRQVNQMAEALHTIAPRGRELLLASGWTRPIRLERRPPKNLEHFIGINDIRVAVERSVQRDGIERGFFFASWELQAQGWKLPLIPDALCQIRCADKPSTICFEYDRGEEPPDFVARTKFDRYARGLGNFSPTRVVVAVDTTTRLKQLRRYADKCSKPDLFSFILRDELFSKWSLGRWCS